MIKTYEFTRNQRRIKIVKEYLYLIEKKHYVPKKAAPIIQTKYCICRKTIYNFLNRFQNIPLRSV